MPLEQARALWPSAEQAVAALRTRVIAGMLDRPSLQAAPIEPDEWLSVKEAARRLGVSPVTIYRNWREYPFTRRQGENGHTLRISSQALDAYQREKERLRDKGR